MRSLFLIVFLSLSGPLNAATCGGSWGGFLKAVAQEAIDQGVPVDAAQAVISAARQSDAVLKRDRSQSVFRQSFLKFSGRAVSADRLRRGAQMRAKYSAVFERAARDYGIPAEVILAFWAMETDYGAVMGEFHTISALATLAHDCRRPELFRPQLIASMALVARGELSVNETGAWAGEIGHVQMLPGDILERGVDGDGDGRITIKTSAPDAILSAAKMLKHHGWRSGEPWLVEVTAPDSLDWSFSGFGGDRSVFDWEQLGVVPRMEELEGHLMAALLLPQGRKGPKFLAFHNFQNVYLEWNKSLVNTTTAAYLAARLGGSEPYLKGNPDPAFDGDQMILLQKRLEALGHDVGKVDGILGAKTRKAVRLEQARLGLPADGWPTKALLQAVKE